MGTRGAIGFIKNNKYKVAYVHYDSYPEGLGQDILNIINLNSVKKLNEMHDNIRLVNEQDIPTQEEIDKCIEAGIVNTKVSSRDLKNWYCLLHGCQGCLDKYAQVGLMPNDKEFLKDSLFCEYAYLVNLDKEILEFYDHADLINTFKLDNCPKSWRKLI